MKRHYGALLEEYLDYFPCVAVIGSRQCGKTTLLKELPGDWKIFDLEKTSDFHIVSRDPDLFFRLNPNRIAVDEAQLLPELFPALRVAIDQKRSQKGRFVITGSSSPALIRSISESLAGRIGIIEMAPFSCSEAYGLPLSPFFSCFMKRPSIDNLLGVLKPRQKIEKIHAYWFKGGYPEPWLNNNPRFYKVWMEQYNLNYVQRDIARLFPGLNQNRFRLFIQLLSGFSGTILNFSDVARALGVSQPVARDYFEIAHGSFIWRNIPPYDRKAMKRVVKHPKGYLRDSGLLHYLLRIPDLRAMLAHPQMGHSWESMVMENILRGLTCKGLAFDYFYYRTGAGAEVDLVLEGDFGLIPFEIKYTQGVSTHKFRSIMDFIKDKGCAFGIVVNNDDAVKMYNEKLLGIPFSCL